MFLDRTQATVANHAPSHVNVQLVQTGSLATVESRIVIVADGLGGQSLAAYPPFVVSIHPNSMHGAQAILTRDADAIEEGTILMACGPGGYVGLVRLEDGRLDVAAAFDRTALREAGNPGQLAKRILGSAHLPVPPSLNICTWHGTPGLTRSRSTLAADRIFLVGDAAGYTEPFTGQGLAWAMCGAIAVTPLARQAIAEWTPELGRQWTQTHRTLIRRSQSCSKVLGWLLRSTRRVDLLISSLQRAPWLAAPVIRALSVPGCERRV
jgi:2-polyprenyl-6-methoxyphenol hydroxylase-like FAD-dependent oxidoreductase